MTRMRLAELQQRRAFECRLTPDRALGSLDEAEAFLLDRGLLTRTADSALPSLFGACHEEPYAPDKPGFGQWPRTKYPWFGELGARGHAILAIHRGKSLLIAPETARLLDPLCRAELAQPRGRPAAAPPGRGRAVRARRPAARARAGAEGAEAAARAARALRRTRRAQRRLRGSAPAHERAGALGPALPGAVRGRRAGRARGRSGAGGGGRARAGAAALVPVVGGRARRAAGLRGTAHASRRTAGWRRKSGAATKDGPLLSGQPEMAPLAVVAGRREAVRPVPAPQGAGHVRDVDARVEPAEPPVPPENVTSPDSVWKSSVTWPNASLLPGPSRTRSLSSRVGAGRRGVDDLACLTRSRCRLDDWIVQCSPAPKL